MKPYHLIIVALAVLTACQPPAPEEAAQLSKEELIKRGQYLTTIGACHDCHSPKIMTPQGPEPDPARLLSGHPKNDPVPVARGQEDWILFSQDLTAFVGPWGLSFSANLTPDDTGIGAWDFEQFKRAIRKGKYKGLEGSRDLLPPMPWQMYRNFTDDDLFAVFTYLKSLPPIDNLVPAPVAPADMQAMNRSK
ncbi:MAG: diheme cytochrome c-553 [Cyclobacteriaceae bacterium]|nr:diheme cytochrome c-553 [Cyclobacteriaceae bacterium]